MRGLVAVGLAGWAAIIGLAWWLADRRIPACSADRGIYDGVTAAMRSCVVRATATRDNVLVLGLTVALMAILALLAMRRPGFSLPASRARLPDAPRTLNL